MIEWPADVESIAGLLVPPGNGILAADESTGRALQAAALKVWAGNPATGAARRGMLAEHLAPAPAP
jgi:hypothetical protein